MLGRLVKLLIVAAWLATSTASAQQLKVLVTNDDGVKAPGIDAIVTALAANPNLLVTVIAPATNQSGTGDQFNTGTIQVQASSTAGAFPAEAVTGFPADTTLFAIRKAMHANPPDLVVSGVNNGQNLSSEIIGLSGTVGAALWSARLGVPAFAVSAGIGATPNYAQAATYTAALVEKFRTSTGFRRKMKETRDATTRGLVLNINFPTCTSGSVRGLRVVAVGRVNAVTDYTLQSSVGGVDTWKPVLTSTNVFASNCASTGDRYSTDVDAFTNGFATLTPLDADRSVSGRKVHDFQFAQRVFH